MRSMLQLLGGVAVAGAVAAGATAFTGSGITPTTTTSKSFIGGTARQQVYGASVDKIVYTWTDGTKTVLTGFDIYFTDTTVETKVPTVAQNTTGGSWAGASGFTCNAVGTNTAQVSNCSAASNYTMGALNYIDITVL
ncbi:hypothetical protein ACQP2F_41700 [Actinoplanes sp. CA-030573]|uniref:hypothetical protein n=1 Tax=Actinoplanes sp. CA-030573 TaxID=3239898 RepID=UPI003D929AAA